MIVSSDRWLFVCSANYIRSPTAEYVARRMGLLADSCGTIPRSSLRGGFVVQPLTEHFIEWARVIVCMENIHVTRVMDFPLAKTRKVFCWDLPDDYPRPYEEALVNICTRKMEATLRAYMSGKGLAVIEEMIKREG